MAFGLFRMMFSAGGNAVPVLEEMNTASSKLIQTSSQLAPSLNRVGTGMDSLVNAASRMSQFRGFESSIEQINAQASFLQRTILEAASALKTLGTDVTGLTEATVQLTSEQGILLNLGLNLTEANKSTAKAFFDVAESIRSVGATGQITSARLSSLSQTLQLFSQNTGSAASAQISDLSNRLIQASAQMKTAEGDARRLSNSNLSLSDSQRLAQNETQKLADSLTRFSIIGGASSGTILKMANQLDTLSQSVHPKFSTSLKITSGELISFSNQLRITEQEARKAGAPAGGFQMMTDVSDGAATRMRQLSSASQGAMIAMSLLQRNVTGLAFSLIFLQFSGFLKLSLAVAGALAAVGAIGIGFKGLIAEGLRLQSLSDKFFILTGSTEASGLALDAARVLVEKYGLKINDLTKFELAALIEKTGPLNEEFDTFGKLLALADVGLVKGVKSSDELIDKFISLLDEGKTLDQILNELGFSAEELDEQFQRFDKSELGIKKRQMNELNNAFREVISGPAASAGNWWQGFQSAWMKLAIGFVSLAEGDWKKGLTNILQGTGAILDDLFMAPTRIMRKIAFNMFLKPFIEPGKKVIELVKNTFTETIPDLFVSAMSKSGEILSNAWSAMVDDIVGFTRLVHAAIKKLFEVTLVRLFNFATNRLGGILQGGWNLMVDGIVGFTKKVGTVLLEFIVGRWRDSFNGLVNVAKMILPDMFSFGVQIVQGLWNGVSGRWGDFVRWLTSQIDIIPGVIKNFFGLNSPSKLMMGLGQNITEGLMIGMNKGFTGSSRTSNSISINVNVSGGFSNDPQVAGRTAAGAILKGITRGGTFSGAPLVA